MKTPLITLNCQERWLPVGLAPPEVSPLLLRSQSMPCGGGDDCKACRGILTAAQDPRQTSPLKRAQSNLKQIGLEPQQKQIGTWKAKCVHLFWHNVLTSITFAGSSCKDD